MKAELDRIYQIENRSMVSFFVDEPVDKIQELESLRGKALNLTVKQHREKRSLNANAYFHVLVDKIAKVLNSSAEDVKVAMVLEYGTILTQDEEPIIARIPVGADISKVYKYAKWIDVEDVGGKYNDVYLLYSHTADLDSAEMAKLIEGTQSEAKELGIETLDEIKLRNLIEEWREQ